MLTCIVLAPSQRAHIAMMSWRSLLRCRFSFTFRATRSAPRRGCADRRRARSRPADLPRDRFRALRSAGSRSFFQGGFPSWISSARAVGTPTAAPAITPSEGGYPSIYRPRNPRASVLYQLMEAHFEDVKACWEERFEKRYGFWRGFVDDVVARYLDCGTVEAGFARLKCDACGVEKLLTLSCKQRGTARHAMPSAPPLSPHFSKTKFSKTSAIASSPSPCQRCSGSTSCITGSFSPISLVSPMRPSRS